MWVTVFHTSAPVARQHSRCPSGEVLSEGVPMTRVTRLLNSYLVVVMLLSLLSASRAHAQTPGPISLVTPLALNPASPGVNVSTQATFTVKNTGGQAITVQAFLVGARDPNNANVDFPGTGQVTLQPGQPYSYSASRDLESAGQNYSARPVWWDGTNWFELDVHTTFTVGNTTPGTISLVTPLALNPASPGVNVSTQATFTVKNTGGQAVTAQLFVVGARDPNNANVDFAYIGPVTLQPEQQYTYSASRSFSGTGTYSDWPAYYDGTNWIELAPHTSFTVTSGTGGAACNLPWGGTIPDGGSVTAYQSSSVSCGNTCTAQTRTCTNGTLSGSYTNSSCTAPTSCTTTTLTVAKDGTGQYSTISDAAAHAQPGYE